MVEWRTVNLRVRGSNPTHFNVTEMTPKIASSAEVMLNITSLNGEVKSKEDMRQEIRLAVDL